jgi:hypothetical protein
MNMKKPKTLKIKLTIQLEGEAGMASFAQMLKILDGNGYHATVVRLVRMLVDAAREHGAAVPADIEALSERGPIDLQTARPIGG